ncbi:S-methyl-5-thioribose kinase [Clostridium magnum]|uniref:S-methyl-5-thioribose kinase n=1 Tax=Clostridium magnum DSM 2767 TaxID=1121326 RepID=A0A162QVQ5_9CLOT|nr:S-methyl-5-thioribose kinase [Clostridium magnum]KZL89035.1 methylthioribose kinase [Clostridium magnum DSM 2767]SHI23134.1 5'-methylthioribose kinase [Clostridium magnum DSM 2767]
MSRFDTYFLMKTEDVEEYVQEKIHFFEDDVKLESKEIGDGNLNYVFRIKDTKSGKSIIVKQAGEALRISKEMKVSTDRGRIEAKILQTQNKYAHGLVPKVYLYDGVMCAIIMEDMIGHTMMRTGLMNHEIYPKFAEHITTFMVNTLLPTTDVVMNHKEKKELVKQFINPDLCEITEDLVYSEPYIDYNHRNNVFPPVADFVQKELYEDKQLHLEVAKLKFDFMNNAQALIHGDLHTGSIFINKEHTFIFDPEFAFYGPIGYDVGNVIANMFFTWCNGYATIENKEKREKFCNWAIDTIEEIVDKFIAKFKVKFRESAADIMAKREGFLDWYLGNILADTAGVAGLESIRRTVGMANVKDITTILDQDKRTMVEKMVITLAKNYIINREKFNTGADYRKAINEVIELYS